MTNLLYTFNQTDATLSSGDIIPLGNVGRKAGSALNLMGNEVAVSQNGYYKVDATFTVLPSVSDAVTVQLYMDGIPIAGARTTATTDAVTTLPLTAIVRKRCNCGSDIIYAVVSTVLPITTVTVSGSSVSVTKL